MKLIPPSAHTPSTFTKLTRPILLVKSFSCSFAFVVALSYSLAAFKAASGLYFAMAKSLTIGAWGCNNSPAIEQHLNKERKNNSGK